MSGIGMTNKSISIFKSRFLKEYLRVEYPKYAQFAHEFLLFLEETNSLDWFEGDTTNQKLNSIYHNIENFTKFYDIENLPIINEDVLNAFFKDYASTLEFRNTSISFSNTVIQNIARNASNIYNLKSSSRAYMFLFSILYAYSYLNVDGTMETRIYFNDQSDFSSQPPEYSAMDEDKIYLLEIPAFDITTNTGEVVFSKNVITENDQGKTPFRYQTISKVDILETTNFSENLQKSFNPAGFFNEILSIVDDMITGCYIDSKTFPKVVITVETVE